MISQLFRNLKLWQISALVAALVAGTGIAYGAYAVITDGSDDTSIAEDEQLIPVSRGTLVNDISVSGALAFPIREMLKFGSAGTVSQVLVEEGQSVTKGQSLATLDEETIAMLNRAVAQAEVSVRDAKEVLAEAQSPATELEHAQAAVNVADARVAYETSLEVLAEAQSPATELEHAQAAANVADARVAYETSLEVLAEAQNPATELERAQAAANVADARVAYETSLETLADVIKPSTQRVTNAAANVANERVLLVAAEEMLAEVTEKNSEAIALADMAVVTAKIALDEAQEALVTTLNGPTDTDIATALFKVDSASTTLANAYRDEWLTASEWSSNTEAAEAALSTAVEDYKEVFLKWVGIPLDSDQQHQTSDALLSLFEVDLDLLFDSQSRFDDLQQRMFAKGLVHEDPDTAWSETLIYIWRNLYPGTIYPTCPSGYLATQSVCVRQELDDGSDLVQEALDSLETTNTAAAKAVANTTIVVARAEDGLATALQEFADQSEEPDLLRIESLEKGITVAQVVMDNAMEELASLMSGPDDIDVEAARTKVALAKANLETAEQDLNELTDNPDRTIIEALNKDVGVAQRVIDNAIEELASLMSGPDDIDVEAARTKVALARANLETAEQGLHELTDDPSQTAVEALEKQLDVALEKLRVAEQDLIELQENSDLLLVALKQSELMTAQASLDAALAELKGETISAPWDGIISMVNIDVGQNVNLDFSAIEIVDPSVVEIDGAVDEIDVLYLREGATASVTMDALRNQTLEGSVAEIADQATNQQGVVTYRISIRVETNDLQLPEGLTAVASVVLREDKDVLLVPLDALFGSFDNPLVRVSRNGHIEERPVELGNTDDFWAVVTSGVVEAELVVMKSQQAETSFGFGGFGRGFGGGFGGNFRRPSGGGSSSGR